MVKNVISTKACFFASKSVGFLNEAILPIFLKFEANLTGLQDQRSTNRSVNQPKVDDMHDVKIVILS